MVFEDLEPWIGHHFFTLLALVGFVSLVWSLDRITQVVMDGLLSFPFCGKKVWLLNMLGRVARSYELYAHGICFIRGLHRKNCFKMEWVLPLFLYGTKSWQNNGPNGQPAQCMTPSEFYKNTGTYIIGFCVYVFVVVRPFATDDVFVYLQLTFWIFPGLVWLSFPK